MANWLASTSFSTGGGTQYDVFLSFRGLDTRNNFIGHLYKALKQKGIRTFIDDKELRRGEDISPSLVEAIRESKISIIIFSKNYASSSWCLDELIEILECRESLGQLVWPVFFNVDPSDVRNHTGRFGKALAKYEVSSKIKYKKKLPNWKAALTKASNLSGWHLAKGDESQLIQRIVEAALSKVNRTPLHVAKYPVGIEEYLQKLEPLLDVGIGKNDVKVIGIYGIGGVGKTTIAKALFNKFADEFEGSSFLANVRETSKPPLGFVQLQQTLLFDMLGDKNLKVGNAHRGINIIKERLCFKRVLVVLDDVDELDQLEKLAGGHEWFGLGSRVIITTRNKHLVTTHGANGIYEVRVLDHCRAVELFSWNAFKREEPVEEYLTLSDSLVRYAGGLPLALEVLGSFLCGRTEHQWKSAIHNLEMKPNKKLYQILRISYDALEDDEKALFLDIACFFVGEKVSYVTDVLGTGHLCPIIGIEVLTDLSLISVEGNRLRMHNLIEETGKEIVRQESLEPGERSRLWFPDDVFHVFSENTGTNSIEGIMLRLPEQRTLYLNANTFKEMKRLRLLIIGNVVLSGAIEYLSSELKLIDLPGYQFPTLPFNCGPKQLVVLNMPHNHIHHLSKGFKNFERLKVVNFSHSKFLRKIPDMSTVPNLEHLFLGYCKGLVEIHESVGYLTRLVILELQFCNNLRIFPRNLVSKYFRTLNFRGSSRLENFPNIVEEMKYLERLDLAGTAIKELPSTIELLVNLRALNLSFCRNLEYIPINIYKLLNLELLLLRGCSKLSKFTKNVPLPRLYDEVSHNPKLLPLVLEISRNFEFPNLKSLCLRNCNLSEVDFLMTDYCFSNLERLNLARNKFVRLPSFRKLFKLSHLNLSNCLLLQNIPELPDSVTKLDASECKSLVETHGKIMAKIVSPNNSGYSNKLQQGFPRGLAIEVILPGNEIPKWFSGKRAGDSISIVLLPSERSKKLAAVIVCAVFRLDSKAINLSFRYPDQNGYPRSTNKKVFSIKSGNMRLFYFPANDTFCEGMVAKEYGVSFSNLELEESTRVVSSCGIHVLWEQDDDDDDQTSWIHEQQPIVVSHPSSLGYLERCSVRHLRTSNKRLLFDEYGFYESLPLAKRQCGHLRIKYLSETDNMPRKQNKRTHRFIPTRVEDVYEKFQLRCDQLESSFAFTMSLWFET